MKMHLTEREFTTVLAALRYWQAHAAPALPVSLTSDGRELLQSDGGEWEDANGLGDGLGFFYKHMPLTQDELGDLCLRINVAPADSTAKFLKSFERHRASDPHCTCNDCIQHHATQIQSDADGIDRANIAPRA